MAKRHGTDVFDEFESSADRLAEWVRANAVWLGAAVLLAVGGSWAIQSWIQGSQTREEEASMALASARNRFLEAMGAAPGSTEVPELANPAAAERIRAEYREQLDQVAEAHAGTVGGALAKLEAIELMAAERAPEETLSELQALLAELPGRASLRPVALQRVAQTQEALGDFAAAAASYEAVSEIRSYPLRHLALAEAARCYAEAGDRDRALAAYDRLDAEAPELRLPEHQRTQARELRAVRGD